jgi:hypothetical protein
MDLQLKDKTALVTGASVGFGNATANAHTGPRHQGGFVFELQVHVVSPLGYLKVIL